MKDIITIIARDRITTRAVVGRLLDGLISFAFSHRIVDGRYLLAVEADEMVDAMVDALRDRLDGLDVDIGRKATA